jgi:hypothetical protein
MITVIAEVGITVERLWRWHWRRRWHNGMAHLEEDVKVGCE